MRGYYREAIEFIALNDEPEDLDPESVAEYVSTTAVAVAFRKSNEDVAKAVVKTRLKELAS